MKASNFVLYTPIFSFSEIDKRLRFLEKIINHSSVINTEELLHEKVNFGSQVTVIDLTTDELKIFIILGTYESNPSENKISNISPVGKQLLGKCVGDEIDFIINETSFSYEIISVEKYMHLS